MMNQIGKTILLGVLTGIASAAGAWLWKKCMEPNADLFKKEYDRITNKTDAKKVETI